MPSLHLALYTEKSNKGGVVRAQLAFSRTCKSRVLCLYREYRAGIDIIPYGAGILVRVNLSISSFSRLR